MPMTTLTMMMMLRHSKSLLQAACRVLAPSLARPQGKRSLPVCLSWSQGLCHWARGQQRAPFQLARSCRGPLVEAALPPIWTRLRCVLLVHLHPPPPPPPPPTPPLFLPILYHLNLLFPAQSGPKNAAALSVSSCRGPLIAALPQFWTRLRCSDLSQPSTYPPPPPPLLCLFPFSFSPSLLFCAQIGPTECCSPASMVQDALPQI